MTTLGSVLRLRQADHSPHPPHRPFRPRFSRQSVNPPVDAPRSIHIFLRIDLKLIQCLSASNRLCSQRKGLYKIISVFRYHSSRRRPLMRLQGHCRSLSRTRPLSAGRSPFRYRSISSLSFSFTHRTFHSYYLRHALSVHLRCFNKSVCFHGSQRSPQIFKHNISDRDIRLKRAPLFFTYGAGGYRVFHYHQASVFETDANISSGCRGAICPNLTISGFIPAFSSMDAA